jgi:thiol-disulfide isomerase/thioredoxin
MKQLITALFLIIHLGLSHAETLFTDTHGQTIDFSALKGKWVVVNYWAQWCDTCLSEIPELNRFYQQHKQSNVVLISVNYDELSGRKLTRLSKRLDMQFPVLLQNPSHTLQLGPIVAIPATFIINPKGQVVKRVYGEMTQAKLNRLTHQASM